MSITARFKDVETDLFFNPLAKFWSNQEPTRCCSKKVLAPAYYLMGMIGYAIAIPQRAFELVIDIIFFIGAVLSSPCRGRIPIKKHGFVLVASVGLLANSIIGTVCPPVAYKIDTYLLSYSTVNDNKFFYSIPSFSSTPDV